MYLSIGFIAADGPPVKRDADESGDAHETVYDSAHDSGLPAKDSGDQIKLECSDKKPVERTDDDESKCGCLHS